MPVKNRWLLSWSPLKIFTIHIIFLLTIIHTNAPPNVILNKTLSCPLCPKHCQEWDAALGLFLDIPPVSWELEDLSWQGQFLSILITVLLANCRFFETDVSSFQISIGKQGSTALLHANTRPRQSEGFSNLRLPHRLIFLIINPLLSIIGVYCSYAGTNNLSR